MPNPKVSGYLFRRYLALTSAAAGPASAPQPAEPAQPQKWWREPLVYLLAFGIPLLLLSPYFGWRPDAEFQAKIQTEAVSFTLGSYDKSGLFVGGERRADVMFEGFDTVKLPGAERWNQNGGKTAAGRTDSLAGGSVRFRNVDLRGLYTPSGTHVTLLWYDASPTGVTLRLAYPNPPAIAAGKVFIDGRSTIEFRESAVSKPGAAQDGVIQVMQADRGTVDILAGANGRLSVSVTPSVSAAKPAEQSQDATPPLPPENHVPLFPGSAISFFKDGPAESAILGDENTVELRNADRKETVLRGQVLEIASLHARTPVFPSKSGYSSEISLELNPKDGKEKKPGIRVNVLGRAGVLQIDGEDKRPSPAEWLRANKILSVWLATAILLGNTLLTILTRASLFTSTKKGRES